MRNGQNKFAAVAILAILALAESASAYYSPAMGRFLGRDPLNEPGAMIIRNETGRQRVSSRIQSRFIPRDRASNGGSGDPNLYAYVENAPTQKIDPFGLECSITVEQNGCFAFGLGCHYTLKVKTENGAWDIDGGSSNNGGGCQKLDVFYNPANTNDMPSWKNEPFNQCACVLHAAVKWQRRRCYRAICGPNSNSAIACILRACNVPVSRPGNAWGWNDLYDHGNDHCTDPDNLP